MAGYQPDSRTKGLILGRRGIALTALAAAVVGVALYAGLVEPYGIVFEEVEIEISGLPGDLEGLRILHLSDLESSGRGRREERVAALGNRARADMVVMTGDLVSKAVSSEARPRVTEEAARVLAEIPARLGTWFVEGHGERVAIAARRETSEALRARGVNYLRDDVVLTEVGSTSIAIVGLGLHSVGPPAEFTVGRGLFVQDGPSRPASYLNLVAPEGLRLQDYRISGAFRFSSERSGIGITFYNQMPAQRDAFYRLRRTASKKELHLSPHGTVFSEGRSAYATVTEAGLWYRFRLEVTTGEAGTGVRARTWPEGEEEPGDWIIDCLDATESRLRSGTVGLWSAGPGRKEIRDLVIETMDGSRRLSGEELPEPAWEPPIAPDFILAAAEQVPPGSFPIVLSHSPDVFPHVAAMGWPLVLAGHTQGGQIRIPFIGALTTDTALGRDYASGLFTREGTKLYITRGVGTTRVPFRFLAPPEVALITLHGTASSSGEVHP